MYSLKVIKDHQRRQEEWDLQMLLAGNLMAQHWNLSVDTRKAGVRTRKDYYKLSYDTQLTEEIDPDLFNKVARRLGGTIKKIEDADK